MQIRKKDHYLFWVVRSKKPVFFDPLEPLHQRLERFIMGDFFGRFFYGLLDFLKTTYGKVLVVLLAPLVSFFLFIFDGIIAVESYFDQIIASGQMAGSSSFSGGVIFGLANHFVPLDVMFENCAILMGVWIVTLIYRFVKSWVPTLS